MPKIQVLDKHTAELIAAGEVVERPASVVKELLENAIDAGATTVTVEIRGGGVRFIGITDNGCGIAREDVPTAFLRHATSKVRTERDLESIGTLGFRGEALASVAAVSRVELLTRTAEEIAGTRCLLEGGENPRLEDAGCPQGTTILVRDLFYNVPARMKFLKKDVSEGNAVAGVVDRIALSHPEISVRFIREGREELLTPGDGDPRACVYAVFGRDFAASLIPVAYALGGIHVRGFVSKPAGSRANRTMQHFFINGRYVKTKTAMAALEQAFKGSIMVGKFPACVLYLEMPPETVDANVHPAKIEVRFVQEKPVFDAVYHAVKSALEKGDAPKQAVLPVRVPMASPGLSGVQTHFEAPAPPPAAGPTARENAAAVSRDMLDALVDGDPSPAVSPPGFQAAPGTGKTGRVPLPRHTVRPLRDSTPDYYVGGSVSVDILRTNPSGPPAKAAEKKEEPPAAAPEEAAEKELPAVRYVGEAFHTYIIAQLGDSLFIIDKHAAHERMLYDRLRESAKQEAQLLLEPAAVTLSREEYTVLLSVQKELAEAGFEVEDFGGGAVLVRTVPMMLDGCDAAAAIQEIAGGLLSGRQEIAMDKLDWIYHSTACRAAVKGGDESRPEELKALAERVLLRDDVRYCPHGRPVCFELTRKELEKQFGRIV